MTTNPALADDTSLDAAETRDPWTSQLLGIFAVRPCLKPEPADDSAPPHSLQVNSDGSVSLERRSTAEIRAMAQSRAGAGEKAPQDVLEALTARGQAANGDPGLSEAIDSFTSRVLCLRTGDRWREAVSTALLGDWTAPLAREGRLTLDAIGALRGEIRTIHRQLMPLWRRRVGGSRVLLLETPLGEDLTLYDLVVGSPAAQDLALGTLPDDPRIGRVLDQLRPEEQLVVLMWTHHDVVSWTEAALQAGASDPVALGERVRRKLHRLGKQHTQRAAAAAATRGGTG